MNLLQKMHLRQKFALLLLAMALPTVLVAVFYLSQSNLAVSTARNELDGARYVQSVGSLLARVPRHRTVTNALLSGDTSGRLEGRRLEDYIEAQIEQLNSLDTELGGRFGTNAIWHGVTTQWHQIRSSAGSVTPEQNLREHDELIQSLTSLVARVSKASDLDLDSDAFTDDLIIAATRNVAQAVIAFSNVDQHSMEVVVKGYLGGDDRTAIQIYLGEMRQNLDAIAQQLVAQPQMQPMLLTTNEKLALYWQMVATRILNADKITVTGSEVYAAGAPVMQALQVLSDSSYAQMEAALRQRAAHETKIGRA